jgi:hypothetical protein
MRLVMLLTARANERTVVIGQTGSGKSTLARVLLRDKKHVLIIDPKGDFQLPKELARIPVVSHPNQLNLRRSVRYIPHPEEDTPEAWNEVFRRVYYKRNMYVYIDEVSLVCKSATSYPQYLRALFQQGRSLGIGVLACTQRPTGVPLFVFSESQQFFVFRLMLDNDLKRVEQWIGSDCVIRPKEKYAFHYRRITDDHSRLFCLQLEGS